MFGFRIKPYIKDSASINKIQEGPTETSHNYRLLHTRQKLDYATQHFQNEAFYRTTILVQFPFFTFMHYLIAAKAEKRSAGKVTAGHSYL